MNKINSARSVYITNIEHVNNIVQKEKEENEHKKINFFF